jgi:hypothetical protein
MPVIINLKPIHLPLHPLVFPPAINQTHKTRWAAVYVLLQGTQAHVTTTVPTLLLAVPARPSMR